MESKQQFTNRIMGDLHDKVARAASSFDYTTHGKVAQALADVALEKWPYNTDKFIGSSPAAKKICDSVGIGNQLIVNMVEVILYQEWKKQSKEIS